MITSSVYDVCLSLSCEPSRGPKGECWLMSSAAHMSCPLPLLQQQQEQDDGGSNDGEEQHGADEEYDNDDGEVKTCRPPFEVDQKLNDLLIIWEVSKYKG